MTKRSRQELRAVLETQAKDLQSSMVALKALLEWAVFADDLLMMLERRGAIITTTRTPPLRSPSDEWMQETAKQFGKITESVNELKRLFQELL